MLRGSNLPNSQMKKLLGIINKKYKQLLKTTLVGFPWTLFPMVVLLLLISTIMMDCYPSILQL